MARIIGSRCACVCALGLRLATYEREASIPPLPFEGIHPTCARGDVCELLRSVILVSLASLLGCDLFRSSHSSFDVCLHVGGRHIGIAKMVLSGHRPINPTTHTSRTRSTLRRPLLRKSIGGAPCSCARYAHNISDPCARGSRCHCTQKTLCFFIRALPLLLILLHARACAE